MAWQGFGRRDERVSLVLAAAMGAMAFGAEAPAAAHARMQASQLAAEVRSYAIPAGTIGMALNRLAEENGVQMVFLAGLTRNAKTGGLKGDYTLGAALDALLGGTGLSYRLADDEREVFIVLAQNDGVRNDASGAEALPPIDVGAQTRRPANGAGDGGAAAQSYTVTHASTATKTNTPLMETPFTVQVMPRQVLKDMGQQQNLGDAMRLLGISTAGYQNYESSFNYRGFYSTATLWNGFRIEETGPTAGPGVGPTWMDNVDRLELMRGPASILYGQVEPGGIVNIITRKPLEEFRGEFRGGLGSWSNHWESVDVTGPLDEDKTLFGRVILSDQGSRSYFTHSPTFKSQGVAPQLTWRVTPWTTLSFEGQYRQVEAETWQKSYSFTDPSTGVNVSAPLSESRLPENVGRWEQSRSMIGLAHHFDTDWSLSLKFMHDFVNEPWAYYQSARTADFSTLSPGVLKVGVGLLSNFSRQETEASTLDVLGHFATFGVAHTLLAGADIYSQDYVTGGNCCPSVTTNIFDPIRARLTTFNPASTETRDRLKYSFYVQDQVELPGNVHVLAGMRYQHIREAYTSGGTPQPTYVKGVVTPRFGVLWRPEPWISAYYSYSENQGRSPGLEYPGTPVKPEYARQHEAGVKTEWFDGRLNATGAVFELTKENIAADDPSHPFFVIGVGKVRSTGYEFNLQGELAEGWNVIANYSYARPLVLVGSSGSSGIGNYTSSIDAGRLLPDVPLRNFSVWTSYRLPWTPELTLGGGASWRSRTTGYTWSTNIFTGQPVSADPFWQLSAFARYELPLAGYKAQLQLNVDNLLDTGDSTNSICYGGFGLNRCHRYLGSPRSARVELRVAF